MKLNNCLTIFLFILTFTTNGQLLKMDYVAKKPIVKFNFENLILYTDTNAVFSIHDSYPYWEYNDKYLKRIKNSICSNMKGDTIVFTGAFIPFNDSIQNKNNKYWQVWLTIRKLIIENKVVIINSKGEIVKKIKIKKKGGKEKCFRGKVFINSESKEELFMYEYRYACLGWLSTY